MWSSFPNVRLKVADLLWGWKPHPKQRVWLQNDSPIKVASCGRRWGKTESESIDAATYAILNDATHQMIIAPTYDQSRLIARGVEELLLSSALTRRQTAVRKTPYWQATFRQSVISARTADDDGRGLRGHHAHRIIVDEAAFVPDSVLTQVVQPMLADYGGQLVMISTPSGSGFFRQMFDAGRRGKENVTSFQFPSLSNPHINHDYLLHQKQQVTDRTWRTEYLAEFVEDLSAAFSADSIDACLALDTPARLPCEKIVVAGIDWARYSDYTALVALDVSVLPWRLLAIDHFQGLSWTVAVERASEFLSTHQAGIALCDGTSVGDPLVEMLQQKTSTTCRVEPLVFTTLTKRELIDNLSLCLSRRSLSLKMDCAGYLPLAHKLTEELRNFEYQVRPGGYLSFSAAAGHHDDLVVALALAAWTAREGFDHRLLSAGRTINAF